MLVLSRKKDETVVVNGNIEIKVLQIKGNMIRLGINAPHDVKVLRGELAPFASTQYSFEVEAEMGSDGQLLVARAS